MAFAALTAPAAHEGGLLASKLAVSVASCPCTVDLSSTVPCAAWFLASSVSTLAMSTAEPSTVSPAKRVLSAGATTCVPAVCAACTLFSADVVGSCVCPVTCAFAERSPVAGVRPAIACCKAGVAAVAVVCCAVIEPGVAAAPDAGAC